MRAKPTLRSFLLAAVLLCGAVWWYGRSPSDARTRALVTKVDAAAVCFRVTPTQAATEDDTCIDAALVVEPLSIGDCVDLRDGHPGFEIAGRAPCR